MTYLLPEPQRLAFTCAICPFACKDLALLLAHSDHHQEQHRLYQALREERERQQLRRKAANLGFRPTKGGKL